MKEKAKVSRETPAQIFASAIANTSDDVRAEIGKKESVKRNIRNTQRGVLPKEVSTLHDLEIEGEWAQATGDQQFLIHDSDRDQHNRVIVFASDEGLRHLATQQTWFMDGTFKIAQKLFEQLYIIRAKVGDSAVTCAYSLMTGKSQALYEEMLQAIVSRSEQLGFSPDPVNIHMDFEQSVIQAVNSTFGDHVNVRGCFYHLTQSTWRKVQQLGLVDQYHTDEEFKLFCGMLDGLAFLPLTDVTEGMTFLKGCTPEGTEALVEYFDSTCVTGSFRRIQRLNGDYTFVEDPPPFLKKGQTTSARPGTMASAKLLAIRIHQYGDSFNVYKKMKHKPGC